MISGCATFEKTSEEGGLFGGLFHRDEPPLRGAARSPAIASPAELPPDPGIPVPYRPADFAEHAADDEFQWHWTATRTGDRIEVKGLIEKSVGSAVRGVTVALSSDGVVARQEVPGLVRSGHPRPFFVAAVLPGDARQARLSIVAVDRSVDTSLLEPQGAAAPSAPLPGEGPDPVSLAEEKFSDYHRDNFFTLRWNATRKGGEIEVSGLVENRNGPMLKDVTLLVTTLDGGKSSKPKRVVLQGVFDKREVKDFSVMLPVATEPERVTVRVESYDFYQPRDK